MTRQEAEGLATFLNGQGTAEANIEDGGGERTGRRRYTARPEPILNGRRSYWVLLKDDLTGEAAAPIVNTVTYLERIRYSDELAPPFVALLERWVEEFEMNMDMDEGSGGGQFTFSGGTSAPLPPDNDH
jgi:hypothetical protein